MAKIYRISSTAGEKVYIGSTTLSLEERWRYHISVSNKTSSRLLCEEYGVNTCSIHLIEEVKEDSRIDRERWWIENTPNAVNRTIPGRTPDEYRNTYHEKRLLQRREYYRENQSKHKEYASARVPCPKCGKELRRDYISRHIKETHLSKVKSSNE